MLGSLCLASALCFAPALCLAPLGAQDEARSDATRGDELAELLANPSAILLKTERWFAPGVGGKTPRLVSAKGGWLAVVGGELRGPFADAEGRVAAAADSRKAAVLDLPAGKTVLCPGFCDADSRWFRSGADLADRGLPAETRAADALETWQRGWDELVVEAGLTTVFVPASTTARQAGPGALVALEHASGPRVLSDDGALFFQCSTLATKGDSLNRAKVAKLLDAALEGAKKYRKARKKWKKDLAEYEKKRKAFLAYYKAHPLEKGKEPAAKEATRRAGGGRRGGRRGVRLTREQMEELRKLPPEQRREAMRKLMQDARKASADAAEPKAPEKKPEPAKDGGKAPPRPKYPKEPKKEPKKNVLLAVLDHKATLRVEAHRKEEIRAVLDVARERSIDKLVLVGCTEAYAVADEIRDAGARVLLAPLALPSKGFDLLAEHWPQSAARLARAGVAVAFGSGSKDGARFLPSFAARAVAHGMSEAHALQALTEAALEVSGTTSTEHSTGFVVWSRDPFAPDARVLCVIQGKDVLMIGRKPSAGGQAGDRE